MAFHKFISRVWDAGVFYCQGEREGQGEGECGLWTGGHGKGSKEERKMSKALWSRLAPLI